MKAETAFNERLKEQDIIRQAKEDARVFKLWYEKYYKPIFLFLFHRTGDKHISADLTSQVFLKALAGLDSTSFAVCHFRRGSTG